MIYYYIGLQLRDVSCQASHEAINHQSAAKVDNRPYRWPYSEASLQKDTANCQLLHILLPPECKQL